MITADLVLATQPPERYDGTVGPGLATFVVEVPAYVWMELLTHKRLARNASSARAQSHQRHAAMGYYVPAQWYRQGTWMSPGLPLDPATNDYITQLVEEHYAEVERRIAAIVIASNGGIAKEQINRLMPISRMMRGVVTATEPAWRAMLALRMVGEMDIFDDVERSRTLLRTALELEYALTALRGASLQVLKQVPRTTP